MTDIEISNSIVPERIENIAKKLQIDVDDIEPYGKYAAKIPLKYIDDNKINTSKLILVTSISPTKAGIGKTTVSVGLSMGLNAIGRKSVVVLREPSLGPCFGMKGGACGGGRAQVIPMDKINLHFTGDFHAVTSAHNMIAAFLDNYLYQNNVILKEKTWRRVIDVNDRGLRTIITGLGSSTNGGLQNSGFDITAASEIMAILCLSKDLEDLRSRIDNITLGYKKDGEPFLCKELNITGGVVALLKDAMLPNLVQTTDGTPAIIHGGPFANIAHGCNSVVATKVGLSLANYVVTEAGFGADLGAEKFFDIKCPLLGRVPDCTVIVATLRGLKMHGGVPEGEILNKNASGIIKGLDNLFTHVHNLTSVYKQRVVVAINRFEDDDDGEIEYVKNRLKDRLITAVVVSAAKDGASGATDLARTVSVAASRDNVVTIENNHPYKETDSLKEKIQKIVSKIYHINNVKFSETAEKKLLQYKKYDALPVCIAKTQYSFGDNPKEYGVVPPTSTFTINDLVVNSGAGFVVAIAGNMVRMPGLPAHPAGENINVDNNGHIIGLN